MGRKYIIFRADWTEEEGAENRLLAHTGGLTDILAEYFDSSSLPIPEPGYRPLEFQTLTESKDTQIAGADTHYRVGDWEVVRVEEYLRAIQNNEFETIVVCYCKYSPVQTPLIPMPKATVLVDSFDSEEKYQQYLEQTKQATALV